MRNLFRAPERWKISSQHSAVAIGRTSTRYTVEQTASTHRNGPMFPGTPVMPGVLIIEAMAQVGGVLVSSSRSEKKGKELLMYFMGIDKARFRKPVVPGDQLVLEIVWTQRRGNVSKMSAKATVDGTLVAEAEVLAMTEEKS
ncbi:MAG: 3-hydroxyacyl-ACP dehydratase FabZ [Candidatus Bathyarchaeota archaeon]|nr:MAG: 3-hydroxyacyl-ACP dehydratase FabZ [Candidatus Bathyarchaeota archaeon]